MTEQEQTIYEWILGHKVADNHLPYPALDYNFAFGVCMPRLRSDGVTAWFNGSDWFLDMTGTENVWESTSFYDALLVYIREVK